MDIEKWLRGLGMQQYAVTFRDNAIDAEILPELTEADLDKLGRARTSQETAEGDCDARRPEEPLPPEMAARARFQMRKNP